MKKVRGIWLTNVDSDVLDSKDNIEAAVKLLSKTGFNVIFPVVWNKGYTLYPSKIMEKNFGTKFKLDPKYQAQERDPLDELVQAAKQHKIKVIPWFEYGFASSHISLNDGNKLEFQKILKDKKWLAFKEDKIPPLIDNGFEWMNALNPEVQAFMIELIVEVAQNYEVDGIQGDDRLPAFPVEGFDQDTANQFRTMHGRSHTGATDSKWMQFRANILTQFLNELCEQVRQVGKNKGKKLLISMAPHPRGFGFDNYLQDTKAWFKLVDMMHPQLYRRTFDDYQTLVTQEINCLSLAQKAKISPGVLMKLGDYRIGEDPNHPDPDYLKEAIRLNRNTGLAGESFFFFEGLRVPNNLISKAIRDHHYAVNQLNDEGPDVFKIQKLLKDLNDLNFDPGEIDGIFGLKTETAVKNFQKKHFPLAKVDGKVGAKTLEKLGVSDLQAFGELIL